jgi:hypothetical protein
MSEGEVFTAALMHNVLYKLFAVDVFFLNVYLFFGLMFSVLLIHVLKLIVNPAFISHLISSMRFKF